MLYNGSIHTSLGVTPNSLKFGHEVPGPGDLTATATDQQKLAIDRNTKYYLGLTQRFSPGENFCVNPE